MFFGVPEKYKFHRYISSGYHGDIYLVYDTRYKILKKYNDIKVGKHETQINNRLCHPNIIKYIESYEYRNCWYVEMPYYQKGSLYSRLLRAHVNQNEYIIWIKQLKSAIDYMHKTKVTHNDLKLNNILLSDDNDIIIIDFGCASENTSDFNSDIESFKHIRDKINNKLVKSKL